MSEWEIDGQGRRFRRVGKCIEYEGTVVTSSGTFTKRQIDAMNADKKEQPAFTIIEAPPVKYCPFKNGLMTDCDRDACAWYAGAGCAQRCPHPSTGKKCPHNNTACAENCALRDE